MDDFETELKQSFLEEADQLLSEVDASVQQNKNNWHQQPPKTHFNTDVYF